MLSGDIMEKITRKDYIEKIKHSGITIVLFGSKCGRCIKAKSTIKKFPHDMQKYYCDIEKNYELCYLLGVLYVPTAIIYCDGAYRGRLIGDEITLDGVKEQLWERTAE